MTNPPLAVPTMDTDLPEPPFPVGIVEELLVMLGRAARAHQLYLPNNPIYKGAIDGVRAAFGPVWERTDEVAIAVHESDLRWCGRVVLEESGRSSESLPWLFYKDGIRELKLLPGFETDEIIRFLDILQRARKAAPDEDDLLTLFWEADFAHLRYKYVDLAMEATAPVADQSEVPTTDPQDVREATQEAVQESKASGIVSMSDFDSTLYFLDDAEIEYLQAEARREYAHDIRSNVVAILLDIFENQSSEEVRDEVLEHLQTMLVYLLAANQLRGVAYLLREAQAAGQRAADLTDGQRARLDDLPSRLSAPEALGQMLQALDGATELPPAEELHELFQQLRPAALETIFGWIARVQNARLKPLLEDAAGRLASTATAELVRLIGSGEREVAAEAIRRAGALKTQAAVGGLSRLVSEKSSPNRLAAAQALAEIGSPGALQALERVVDDADREVRMAALRALGARAYRPVLPKLEAIIKGKAIREADLTEKMTAFEAYGALCGEAGIPYLDGILNGKGFLGRREDAEIRACAAIALGRVGTPTAAEALRQAQSEKDVVVRNAVGRALRGSPT